MKTLKFIISRFNTHTLWMSSKNAVLSEFDVSVDFDNYQTIFYVLMICDLNRSKGKFEAYVYELIEKSFNEYLKVH